MIEALLRLFLRTVGPMASPWEVLGMPALDRSPAYQPSAPAPAEDWTL